MRQIKNGTPEDIVRQLNAALIDIYNRLSQIETKTVKQVNEAKTQQSGSAGQVRAFKDKANDMVSVEVHDGKEWIPVDNS